MRYVGVVIQQLWTDQQGGRAQEHHPRRRSGEVPGSVRRRTSPRRSQRD